MDFKRNSEILLSFHNTVSCGELLEPKSEGTSDTHTRPPSICTLLRSAAWHVCFHSNMAGFRPGVVAVRARVGERHGKKKVLLVETVSTVCTWERVGAWRVSGAPAVCSLL